mmetsp:Transcript_48678/g.105542  ORF Transcript_48678/g.105542 Transcript_48678/m.105542 type:complete len:104 (-) Transcript_48678:261-572(-)
MPPLQPCRRQQLFLLLYYPSNPTITPPNYPYPVPQKTRGFPPSRPSPFFTAVTFSKYHAFHATLLSSLSTWPAAGWRQLETCKAGTCRNAARRQRIQSKEDRA